MKINPHLRHDDTPRVALTRASIHSALASLAGDVRPLSETEWANAVNAWYHGDDATDIARDIIDARNEPR